MSQFFLYFLSIFLVSFLTLIGDSNVDSQNVEYTLYSNPESYSDLQSSSRPSMAFFQSRLWKNFVQHRNSNEIRRPFRRPRKQIPSTSELIRRAGFDSEIHTVTTEDEYILTIDRIPGRTKIYGNVTANVHGEKKPAVLLYPNMMACSDGWFINSPEKSLPFLLSERNFDVWLANPRGCVYSTKHKWKKSPEFWNFSFHEQGVYDLSAQIDYILAETGHSQLNYIGYSLGTTVQFVLLSERPEYNKKLNMSILLGAAAYASNIKSPIIKWAAQMSQRFPPSSLSQMLTGGSGELLPRTAQALDIYRTFCGNMDGICRTFTFATMGFDNCQYDKTVIPRYLEFFPAGVSFNTVLHYLQLINNGTFRQFDHGEEENRIRYGNSSPPLYNLNNVKSPQIIFYSDGDFLANSKDAKLTASKLSSNARVKMCRVKFSSFNHLDFIWAKDVNLLVNDRVIRVLNGDSCSENKNGNDDDTEDEESIKCPPENSMVNSQSVNRALQILNRWITPTLQEAGF